MTPRRPKARPVSAHVDEAVLALSASKTLHDYFSGEINELSARKQQWESAGFRVGLIGLTSTGKSTLLNAMMGAALLPAGIPPSSNVLVICRRGSNEEAVLAYEDGRREVVKRRIKERLGSAVDERTNPGNKQHLKQVELYSPRFMLPSDITLVDTPGLNAYGLEHHESLTMKLFLPSVDMVVFTTTAKANSDREIKSRLDRIGQEGKPIVLVQTMIDSVEPKLGKHGQVHRSSAQVAADHRERLRKMLQEGLTDHVRSAPIFQVSALLARKGAQSKSGLPELVHGIQQRLAELRPAIAHGRRKQASPPMDLDPPMATRNGIPLAPRQDPTRALPDATLRLTAMRSAG